MAARSEGLIILARGTYRSVLLGSRWISEVPMGLGIGQQLGWLTAQLNAPAPA
ncbi:hypothetical protein [Pseudarthrobacter sp. ATCC 49987]|uniref:hypothetical protein n=1 Tax=Pseudarthrobacter sp. ATCC 49987 TaxID=2698204 RepID=UPI001369E3DB|nr:hypothetical protein [Pseudarthrobacter sp. ATCC 49987]